MGFCSCHIISFFLFLIYFSTENRIKNLLQKEGGIVAGGIFEGKREISKSLRGRTQINNSLELYFYTKDKKYMKVSASVSDEAFRSTYKGAVVKVVYLPSNPLIYKVLLDEKSILDYLGIKSRPINIDDLTALITMPEDSVLGYLNKVSYEWKIEQIKTDSGSIFINNYKREGIYKNRDGTIMYQYVSNPNLVGLPDNFIKKLKILKRSAEKLAKPVIAKMNYLTEKYEVSYFLVDEGGKINSYLTGALQIVAFMPHCLDA